MWCKPNSNFIVVMSLYLASTHLCIANYNFFFQNGKLEEEKKFTGLGLCPFDPALNTTAVYAGKLASVFFCIANLCPKFNSQIVILKIEIDFD